MPGPRISTGVRLVATAFFLSVGFSAAAHRDTDPARWDDVIEAWETVDDRMQSPPEGAIVLTGSSSIMRWNHEAAEALAPLTVIPRGFGGSIMGDVLHHLDSVALRHKPRAIVIYEGDNDTAWEIPEETIIDQLEQIVERVHEALPATRIYVMAVKPSIRRWDIWDAAQSVNARYRKLADADPLVYYVDSATPFLKADGTVMDDVFVDDDLHFNAMGNLIWGAVIRSALMPMEVRFETGF